MSLPRYPRGVRIGNDRPGGGINPFAPQSVVVVRTVEGRRRRGRDRPVTLTEADAPWTGHVPDTKLGVRKLVENTADKPPPLATTARR